MSYATIRVRAASSLVYWVIVAACTAVGCDGMRLSDDERHFLKLSYGEQQAHLRVVSDSEKVVLFEVALARQHPPNLGLATSVAASGRAITPTVVWRAKLTSRPVVFAGYVSVMSELERAGQVSVSDTTVLLELLDRANSLGSGMVLDESKRQLQEILEASRSKALRPHTSAP